MLRRAVAALVLVLATGCGGSTPSAEIGEEPTEATRVMLFGDSVTMGSAGDWTWRYRLWQSLEEAHAKVDLVGPRNDVIEYTTWKLGSQQYRNPGFDTDHAALAGQRFVTGALQLDEMVRIYAPDVVVAFIGASDLKDGTDVATLEDRWRTQVSEARTHESGVDLVLVQAPHTWIPHVDDYNAMLRRLADELDTAEERVLVTARPEWSGKQDTYDLLHPTTSGEHKVAAVVAPALAELGIGSGKPATTPDPPDGRSWAPNPKATVADGRVTVSWSPVAYATSQHVTLRDVTADRSTVRRFVRGRSVSFEVEAGHTYEIWLRPVRAFRPLGTRSEAIEVTVPE